MSTYDVIIIGTGTAGQTAAGVLAERGRKIAVIDKQPFGGTCALRGCQPKKFYVVQSHLAAATRALLGSGLGQAAAVDWGELQQAVRGFTDPIPGGTASSLKKMGADTFTGPARIISPNEVSVGNRVLTGEKVLIASGARPRQLSVPGGELAASSDRFLRLERLPEQMVFIGGGYISMEFAFIAALCGSQVTVLQRGSRILPRFPASLTDHVMTSAAREGITIVTNAEVTALEKRGKQTVVSTKEAGEFSGDFVMAAVGRAAETEELGLEELGMSLSAGAVVTNEFMESSIPGIFAAGDCVNTPQLSPISDMEAKTAAQNICSPSSLRADYTGIPSVVFTHPQIASVGIAPDKAGNLSRGSGASWPSSRRLHTDLVYYEIAVDPESDLIQGAHLVGPNAGELINLFALALRHKIPAAAIRELPWAYPTCTSDIKYMV